MRHVLGELCNVAVEKLKPAMKSSALVVERHSCGQLHALSVVASTFFALLLSLVSRVRGVIVRPKEIRRP